MTTYLILCSLVFFSSFLKHILKLCFLRFEISRFGIIVSECHKLILIVIELINFYYELKWFKKESDHKPEKRSQGSRDILKEGKETKAANIDTTNGDVDDNWTVDLIWNISSFFFVRTMSSYCLLSTTILSAI